MVRFVWSVRAECFRWSCNLIWRSDAIAMSTDGHKSEDAPDNRGDTGVRVLGRAVRSNLPSPSPNVPLSVRLSSSNTMSHTASRAGRRRSLSSRPSHRIGFRPDRLVEAVSYQRCRIRPDRHLFTVIRFERWCLPSFDSFAELLRPAD